MVATTTQGYITLATGPQEYLEMAANLAASIKVMNSARPVCLVHDAGAAIPTDSPPVKSARGTGKRKLI